MTADYHVHTYYSHDSSCPMADMIERALELGIDELCFTDHVDYGINSDEDNCCYERYFEELERRKKEYEGRIKIKRGIEFGVQRHTKAEYERDAEKYPFDFIILSNHQIDDKGFWDQSYQKGKTQDEYQRAYYEELLWLVENYNDYSVLGHLDMIKRYDRMGDYPDHRITDTVEAIFKKIIPAGKGIEVNTSSFHYGLKDLTPSRKLLALYRDMGGELITLGSDAHSTEYLGDHIPEVKNILRDMGFKYFCTFTELKPEFHRL